MKKLKIAALSLAVLVAGTGAFHAYGNYQQSGESDALLTENLLALSNENSELEITIDDTTMSPANCDSLRGTFNQTLYTAEGYKHEEELLQKGTRTGGGFKIASITYENTSSEPAGENSSLKASAGVEITKASGDAPHDYMIQETISYVYRTECVYKNDGCCRGGSKNVEQFLRSEVSFYTKGKKRG